MTNAYWSPRYFQYAQVPDIPLTRAMGPKLADILFRRAYRPAFAWHARAYAETARHFGVSPAPGGLLGAYTASDCTAYADVAGFYNATSDVSSHEIFIGPLLWSPEIRLPPGPSVGAWPSANICDAREFRGRPAWRHGCWPRWPTYPPT